MATPKLRREPSRRHHSPRGVETLRQHRRGQSALLSRRGTSRGEVPHARAAADLGGRKPRPRARLHPKGGEPRGTCGSVFRPRAGRQFHRAAFRARRGEGRGARRGAPQHRNKSVLPRCFGTRHGLPCRHRTRRHRPHALLSPLRGRGKDGHRGALRRRQHGRLERELHHGSHPRGLARRHGHDRARRRTSHQARREHLENYLQRGNPRALRSPAHRRKKAGGRLLHLLEREDGARPPGHPGKVRL